MARLLVIGLLILVAQQGIVIAADPDWHWSYVGDHGPAHWPEHYEECVGKKQSPIDIVTSEAVFNDSYSGFQLVNFDREHEEMGHIYLQNNGHTVRLDVEGMELKISAPHLDTHYQLKQLHFHWGSKNSQGSEHLRDGKAYPMEMHMVDWSTKYHDINEAAHIEGGLAALSFFIEVSDTENSHFAKLTDQFGKLKYPGNKTELEIFPVESLLPDDISRYYTYQGGLTTPGCDETVTWTLFQDTIKISQNQLDKFRTLLLDKEGGNIEDNFRPVQKLYGRQIYTNIPADQRETSAAAILEYKMAATIFLLLLTCLSSYM